MRLQLTLPTVEQMILAGITDFEEDDDLQYFLGESDCCHALEILNMEYTGGTIILNEGFDIQFATDEIDEYLAYIEDDTLTAPLYYQELLDYNDGWLGDDTCYDYAGSFVYAILEVVNWCLEQGSYIEIN